jgi:hypothetical protein
MMGLDSGDLRIFSVRHYDVCPGKVHHFLKKSARSEKRWDEADQIWDETETQPDPAGRFGRTATDKTPGLPGIVVD